MSAVYEFAIQNFVEGSSASASRMKPPTRGLLSPELARRNTAGQRREANSASVSATGSPPRRVALVNAPTSETLRVSETRAILAVLLGCGFASSEWSILKVEHLQRRREHWAVVDLVGKVGTFEHTGAAVVKARIDDWTQAVGYIRRGAVVTFHQQNGVVWEGA